VVSHNQSGRGTVIVARPNRSASWQTNKLFIALLAIPSFGAAIAFTALGAWPILPFAGLEIAALTASLYYVNWKLQYRHVITLDGARVRIDKGHYAPRRCWDLERSRTALAVTPERHPWEGPGLVLYSEAHKVPVGGFLNREDSLALLALLRREFRVGTAGPVTRRSL